MIEKEVVVFTNFELQKSHNNLEKLHDKKISVSHCIPEIYFWFRQEVNKRIV